MQIFFEQLLEFLKGAVAYYTVQLGRSAMLSIPILLIILILRRTICRKTVFVKGLLWTLLIPLPFMGKMKFFYETEAGIGLFRWWQKLIFENIGLGYLYLLIVVLLGILIFTKRRKLWLYAKKLNCTKIDGTTVYISDLTVTPFVVGVVRPKIVLPEIMVDSFNERELKTIIVHEQVHIKQGHLVWYVLWDIIRMLLWINPFIHFTTKYFKDDLEDICDKVVIYKENHDFYNYGKVLLHSIRCLKDGENHTHTLAFTDDSNFESVKRRITKVSEYRPYRRALVWGMSCLTIICVFGALAGVYQYSYKRCNEMNIVSIYNMTDKETVVMADKDILAKAIYSDDKYVYIDISVLDNEISLDMYRDKELFICTGGWYKMPGIGGGGEYVVVKGEKLIGNECKIPYDMPEDTIWIKMLKLF